MKRWTLAIVAMFILLALSGCGDKICPFRLTSQRLRPL